MRKKFGDFGVRPPGEPMPNARMFLEREYWHDDRSLLIYQGGQFYRWDGTCWPALEDSMLRAELYGWFETKNYISKDGEKPFAPTRSKIANLMDATKAISIIDTSIQTPAWLSPGNYPANELISCANGLVHWPSRMLCEHRPGFYAHYSLPFQFDPNAQAPARWLAFLHQLWTGEPETIAALQEMFGYLVSGDTRQQKLFLLVGPKRGGKGTLARVLTRMLGRHNVAGPTLASLGTNFGLQDLAGKPVAIISDARIGSKSDASLIAERLLSISGEDLQNVDRKYLPPWSGYLPTRFVMLTNELPRFPDPSGALASRFIVLMLQKSFYGREDPSLTETLCEELPGIFNWALDGLQSLLARGRFHQPEASRDAIQELEDLASPVGAFIRDCCRLGPDEMVEVDLLYKRHQQWCEESGIRASSKAIFGRDLKAARPEIKRGRLGGRHLRKPSYMGISIASIPTTPATDHGRGWGSLGNTDCSADILCAACDGKGCPTCIPEAFGLPWKRQARACTV